MADEYFTQHSWDIRHAPEPISDFSFTFPELHGLSMVRSN